MLTHAASFQATVDSLQDPRRASGARSSLALTASLTLGLLGCAHGPPRFDVRVRRTCLVLSAGGTRGIAELGAIAAVREAGIPMSCVVGDQRGGADGWAVRQRARGRHHPALPRTCTRLSRRHGERGARRGWQAGAVLGTLAATLSGGVLAPAAAALGGYLLGAATTARPTGRAWSACSAIRSEAPASKPCPLASRPCTTNGPAKE